MNKRSPTLKEIAERVGVGTSTASVVLNGARSGTKVSDQTRDEILRVARELNYRPNGLARSLRKRRTGIVGFFSGYEYIDPLNPYIAEVMSGLHNGCARYKLDLLLYTPHTGHTPEEIVANLADGRLDGLVMTARPDHPLTSRLADTGLPVVALADRLPQVPCVLVDSAEGGRLQARHLAEKGHRRVLYIPSDYPFPSVLERQFSFLEEAERLGIAVQIGTPISGHHEHTKIESVRLWLAPEDVQTLTGSEAPTAVLCWDDAPAFRVASQLASLGLRVPEDVAVVGYNGCETAVEPRWRLTTVRAHWSKVGAAAVDLLHACIEGQEVPQETVLPVELIVGATT